MSDGADILAEPMKLIERAVKLGSAKITFLNDEATARKFYQRARALLHGRAKHTGVWLSREGTTVKAVKDPELMPKTEVE